MNAHHTTPSRRLARSLSLGLSVVFAATLAACGGGGGDAPAATAALGDVNVTPVYVDGGPNAPAASVPNAIYADVKICAPGSATNCAVIDHVLVDTGSVGLRLFASSIPSALLAAMPQSNADTGALAGECLAFASGVTWGGVRLADMLLGGTAFNGELAANLPIQVVGDSDPLLGSIPASCSSQGSMMTSSLGMGANGIIGVGLFAKDCGTVCATAVPAVYYSCASAGACAPASMAEVRQVANPISSFAVDFNGNTIAMPAPSGGAASRTDGLLVFGIGTRSNNALAAGSSVLGLNTSGYFQSVLNGNTLSNSFIDSGSSVSFFPAAGSVPVPVCAAPNASFLCPASPLTMSAANSGRASTSSLSDVFVVNAVDVFTASPSATAISGLAGPSSSPFDSLDLGMSFFYGRSVSTLIEAQSAPGFTVAGPAFSHTP